MAKSTRASVRGQGGSAVEGRHRGFRVNLVPIWHPDAQGGHQCVGVARVASVTLRFDPGRDDPAAALGALQQLLTGPVELRLPNFALRGRIVFAEFHQEADVQCRATGATAELRIEGDRE